MLDQLVKQKLATNKKGKEEEEEVNKRNNWFRGSFLDEELVHALPGPSSGAQGQRKNGGKVNEFGKGEWKSEIRRRPYPAKKEIGLGNVNAQSGGLVREESRE